MARLKDTINSMEALYIESLIEKREFNKLKEDLAGLDKVEVVDLLSELEAKYEVIVFKLLSKDMAADVFAKLEPDQMESIIRGSTDREVADIVSLMFMDDLADVVEEMPANAVSKILKNTSKEDRDTINQILRYPEDSAGSIMTTEYVELKAKMTAREALRYINSIGQDVVSVYVSYVVDSTKKLVGSIDLREIIMAEEDELVLNLMDEDETYVYTLDDRELVIDEFKKYGHNLVPVVDEETRMVGIITVDDIFEVMEEEDTEDFQKMNAILPSEDKYLTSPPALIAKSRIPWLVMLMLTSTISGSIIKSYTGLLASFTVLNTFIPMLMGTGGNAGNQSSTMIIRGISTGEIELKDWKKVLKKEVTVSLMLGVILVLANFIRMSLILRDDMTLTLIVCASLFLTVLTANVVGSLVPIAVKKANMDPANVASPLLTTVVDIISLLIYFNIANTNIANTVLM